MKGKSEWFLTSQPFSLFGRLGNSNLIIGFVYLSCSFPFFLGIKQNTEAVCFWEKVCNVRGLGVLCFLVAMMRMVDNETLLYYQKQYNH